jgi:PKHD-type hydroxylase
MLVRVQSVLSKTEVAHFRAVLERADWIDGKVTAGQQSAVAKTNLQVPENSPQARELGDLMLRALGRSDDFYTAALPSKVFPPLFNRYDVGMNFGAHVDNAIRHVTTGSGRIRTDVSTTVFLSEPDEYDGGELVIQDTYGEQKVKFVAGDAVIYPATSLHRVEPVTRGSRWASFFWTQSMVRDDGQRALLYNFDAAIRATREKLGDEEPSVLALTATYHNLLRQWVDL